MAPAKVEARPRRRAWLLIAPMIAGAGMIGWWLSANWDARTAPQLEGRLGTDAEAQLEELGLDARIVRLHNDRPAGVVTEQTPSAGTEMQEGDTIILEVSKGAAHVGGKAFGFDGSVRVPAGAKSSRRILAVLLGFL